MAKSLIGGTRSILRGRVGADVYSVGRNGKGQKQQVVRALAEQVKNPRSSSQMRNRMKMTAVANLARALRPVINHSFDNVSPGMQSVAEFNRLALQAFAADIASNQHHFGYPAFGSKAAPACSVQISQGKVVPRMPWLNSMADQFSQVYQCVGCSAALNIEGYDDTTPISKEDFINVVFGGSIENRLTLVGLQWNGDPAAPRVEPVIVRLQLRDDVAFNGELIDEGNFIITTNSPSTDGEASGQQGAVVLFSSGEYTAQQALTGMVGWKAGGSWKPLASAMILSVNSSEGWKHSTSFLSNEKWQFTADIEETPRMIGYEVAPLDYATALATYPEGEAKFLNGGDI